MKDRIRQAMLAMAAGWLGYGVALGCNSVNIGGIRPEVGCVVTPAFPIVNAPSVALDAVWPNNVVRPQGAGLRFGRLPWESEWSPTAFVLLGAGFYGLLGFLVGLVFRRRWPLLLAPSAVAAAGCLYLVPHVATWSSPTQRFLEAVRSGEMEDVRAGLSEGVSTEATSREGAPALLIAIERGEPAIVDALLVARADFDQTFVAHLGMTPLMVAAQRGYDPLVGLLLARGATVDARSTATHWTALMFASAAGKVDVVARLLASGASVRERDGNGLNALALAVQAHHGEVARMLRDAGATE